MERQIKIDLFATIEKRLSTASKIAVLCHAYGDGDCYGSALALQSAVSRVYGQNLTCCTLISQEPVGSKYSFMPGVENIKVWPDGQDKYDLVLTVDTASTQLLGSRVQLLDGAYVISFDHHSSFTAYADVDVRGPAGHDNDRVDVVARDNALVIGHPDFKIIVYLCNTTEQSFQLPIHIYHVTAL